MYNKRSLEKYIAMSKKLLSNSTYLYDAMILVIDKWVYAVEENLSNYDCNRRAWLGQAACFLRYGSTKIETCEGWRCLTDKQRIEANNVADKAINMWESN